MGQPLHICHLTILNSVLHSRIFYKYALSQLDWGYAVSVWGQGKQNSVSQKSGVQLFTIAGFSRLSAKRFWLPFRLKKEVLALKPDIVFLHSPELLWLARHFHAAGIRVVYDMHEDYYLTLRHSPAYPTVMRKPLSRMVRNRELQALPYLAAVVYAEKIYDNVLQLPPHKKWILENTFTLRAVEGASTLPPPDRPYMLYSGTIAEAWGIMDSLNLWARINQHRPLSLIVAGFTSNKKLIGRIRQFVKERGLTAYFTLLGGVSYVPYADIVHLIRHSWFVTGLYHPVPFVAGKVPTKFYEAHALGRPVVFTRHPAWNSLNEQYQWGVPYADGDDISGLLQKLTTWKRPETNSLVLWDTREAVRLKQLMDQLASAIRAADH